LENKIRINVGLIEILGTMFHPLVTRQKDHLIIRRQTGNIYHVDTIS